MKRTWFFSMTNPHFRPMTMTIACGGKGTARTEVKVMRCWYYDVIFYQWKEWLSKAYRWGVRKSPTQASTFTTTSTRISWVLERTRWLLDSREIFISASCSVAAIIAERWIQNLLCFSIIPAVIEHMCQMHLMRPKWTWNLTGSSHICMILMEWQTTKNGLSWWTIKRFKSNSTREGSECEWKEAGRI